MDRDGSQWTVGFKIVPNMRLSTGLLFLIFLLVVSCAEIAAFVSPPNASLRNKHSDLNLRSNRNRYDAKKLYVTGGNSPSYPIEASIESSNPSPIVKPNGGLLHAYSSALESNPWTVKMATSGVIGGIGDLLTQYYQRRSAPSIVFDFRRMFVFAAVATFYFAPIIHVWFNWLNSLPFPSDSSVFLRALMMMTVDQTVGASVVTTGFFIAFEFFQRVMPPRQSFPTSLLESATLAVKTNLWKTLVANWYCWPILNFINFLWVPVQYRVLFTNFAAVFWNMYLSSIANKKI